MYKIITKVNQLEDFKKDLQATDTIAYDIEARGLNFLTDAVRLAQFEINGNTYILNIDNKKKGLKLYKYAMQLVEATGKIIIAHNAKFEIKFTLANTGVMLENVYDTQVAESVLMAGIGKQFTSLKDLVKDYCGVELSKEETMLFVTSDTITENMFLYAALDVKYLKEIRLLQLGEAITKGISHILELEMALVPVVARMEYDGVFLNEKAWMELYEQNLEKAKLNKKIILSKVFKRSWPEASRNIKNGTDAYEYYDISMAGYKVAEKQFLEDLKEKKLILEHLLNVWNPNSYKQMKKGLQLSGYSKLTSTGKEILTPLANDQLIQSILDYRFYSKRIGSFGKAWLKQINPISKRIHPQFNQTGTTTGRFSSDNPNMQNIIADEIYRKCFIARPGYKLITADYSQAELRLVASICKEPKMIEAFQNGYDIHKATAASIFEIPIDKVDSKQRSRGKTMNFSILYGVTPFGIARRNKDINEDEGQMLVEKFFSGYPRLHAFIEKAGETIWERRYSKTPLGRIRFFEKDKILSRKEFFGLRAKVKREGVNHIIQGGSADMLKEAMVSIYKNSPWEHDWIRILIQVHDEIVVEVKDEIAEEARNFIVNEMVKAEQKYLGDIPAIVDVATGKNGELLNYWSKGE